MELLAASTLVDDDFPLRNFYLCSADSVDSLSDEIRSSSPNFGLFLALEAGSFKDEDILQGAKKLIAHGMACLCAWGPDCERIHDLFDVAARETNDLLTGEDVIMTTWHSGESLEQALWFFVHTAFVTRKFEKTCADWMVAPIANTGWRQLIKSKFAEIIKVKEDD